MYCFFFKQKTAYELRISDWSSDVCSSDLLPLRAEHGIHQHEGHPAAVVAVDMGEHDRVDRVVLDPQFIERNQARRAEVDGEPNPRGVHEDAGLEPPSRADRKSTRLNSSH